MSADRSASSERCPDRAEVSYCYPPMSTEGRGGTQVNPIPSPRAAAVPRLVAMTGPSAGRGYALRGSTATVGRHPTNDFVVEDPRVSGTHLELTRVGDRVRIHDVGSTNGTWLGHHRVVDVELAPGAELTIGDSVIKLDIDEAAAPAPAAARESFG